MSNFKNILFNFLRKHRGLFIAIGVFLVYFILMSALKNGVKFLDEADNMLGGATILNGGLIYKDYLSQHLPLMYFLMAPFMFLQSYGVHVIRTCFYLVIALILTLIYVRYSKKIGKLPIFLYGLFYIGMMASSASFSMTILADQIEALCVSILFFELYLFYRDHRIDKHSGAIIGLCMFSAIWSAIVSVIPIFIFVITFIIFDVIYYRGDNTKFRLSKYLADFFKKYYKIFIYCLIPSILMLAYFAINNDLYNLYQQVFYLNTKYYSQYNGYSSNPIVTIIKLIPEYFQAYSLSLRTLISAHDYHQAFLLVYCLLNIVFVFALFKKDKLFLALSTIFILACGNRGFNQFHAIPYYAVSIASFLVIFQSFKFKCVRLGKYICVFTGLILLIGYVPYGIKIFDKPESDSGQYKYTLQLTNDSDYVYCNDTDLGFFMNYVNYKRKSPSSVYTLVPFFVDMYGKDLISGLNTNKPKIIFYTPSGYSFGVYRYEDFAIDLDTYVKKNYTYSSQMGLWIRNDYVSQAEVKTGINVADETNAFEGFKTLNPILDNTIIDQTIRFHSDSLKSIGLKFDTYQRINYSLIEVSIYDDSHNLMASSTISADNFKDGDFYNFDFGGIKVDKNSEYTIQIKSESANNFDNVTIYTTDRPASVGDKMYINGVSKQMDLIMNVYYK